MARTSSFVSNHGGQSEIVLRVKQGGNPTFGFLMPDHRLHPYFRFLVEHQELLTGKSSVGDKKVEGGKDSGALSLLGSIYGTVEDEDTKEEAARDSKTKDSGQGDEADSSGPEVSKEAAKISTVRDVASKHPLPSNDQAPFIKRNPSVSAVNVVERKQINTEDNVTDKPLTSEKFQSSTMLAQPKLELQIVEPPIEMKRAIDKIVDFIQKNGKELEATLAAQDVKYGMFPFLRPASLYHAYYRKVLQEAEELRSCNKGDFSKKEYMKQEKMDSAVKDDKPALGSVLQDDSAKREKQKMVSEKPKIELQKEPFKPVEPQMRVTVDANTAAAILEAARRGIRNPQLGILSGKPLDETSQSHGNDGGNTSSKSPDLAKSLGQPNSGSAAASEADSSESGLTKEQKLKAERLKRAKMFVAMLKPSAQAAQQAEPSRSLSVEPLGSGSGSNAAKEREVSSLPSEAETKLADDGNIERRTKRNYRSRSERDEDDEVGKEEDKEESSMEEVTEDTKIEKKHSSRKRHDRHKHKTRHSSKDRHSRDKHKHESSSDDEYQSRSRHRHKHRKSSDRHELYDSSDTEREHRHRSSKHDKDTDYSKDKRSHWHRSRKHDKHLDSSDDEHRRRRRHRSSRRKHEDSSDSEHGHRQKSSKRIKKDEKRVEEECVSNSNQSGRKASPEDNNNMHPQNEPTQVSDELRAKIRAMLADTL